MDWARKPRNMILGKWTTLGDCSYGAVQGHADIVCLSQGAQRISKRGGQKPAFSGVSRVQPPLASAGQSSHVGWTELWAGWLLSGAGGRESTCPPAPTAYHVFDKPRRRASQPMREYPWFPNLSLGISGHLCAVTVDPVIRAKSKDSTTLTRGA